MLNNGTARKEKLLTMTFLEWLADFLSATRVPRTFGLIRYVALETKAELQSMAFYEIP